MPKKQRKVFLVVGESESGDHYRAVFDLQPTADDLSLLVHEWDGDPAKEGPGYDGSYVHIDVEQVSLR